MMDLITGTEEFIRSEKLDTADAIVVGLSAGPDSAALLHILHRLASQKKITSKIYAVHINHNIRIGECDADEKLARAMCGKLGIPLKVYSVDIPAKARELGKSEEETGRIIRYSLLEEFADSLTPLKADVAVAHHKGDVLETMLMNLFRGCGIDGLISPSARNGRIIRPLLCFTKAELQSFLEDENIIYALDRTNMESCCTRNIYRNEILPRIREVSIKDPAEAIWETRELLRDDSEYINSAADDIFARELIVVNGSYCLPTEIIKNCHRALAGRLIRKLRRLSVGNLTDFSNAHVSKIRDMLDVSGRSFLSIDLPFDTCAVRWDGLFFFGDVRLVMPVRGFCTCVESVEYNLAQMIDKNTKLPHSDIQINVAIVENSEAIAYNSKSWFFPLKRETDLNTVLVRNNLPDVRFRNAGSPCAKSLYRKMTDAHIPAGARASVIAVTTQDRILWIPGIGHSEGFVSASSFEAWKRSDSHDGAFIKIDIEIGGVSDEC